MTKPTRYSENVIHLAIANGAPAIVLQEMLAQAIIDRDRNAKESRHLKGEILRIVEHYNEHQTIPRVDELLYTIESERHWEKEQFEKMEQLVPKDGNDA